MRKPLYIFFLFIIIFSFSLCRKDKGLSNYGNYPNDVGKIITIKCATSGCHNDASYPATNGLNLTTWADLFNGSKNGSPVVPYSSKFSSLCYFINTYPDLGLTNLPVMPLTGSPPLSREEVNTIKNWIDAGAPDINGFVKWSDNPNRKKIYVTNQGCDVVTVFDSETMLPMRFIQVGNNSGIEVPHMVKVSPDGQYWYVVFVNNNILQKYRCSDDALVGEANLGPNFDWNTIVITKDGKKAFCVAWTSNGHVASVDLDKMKLIRNYGGFVFPHGVALNKTNDFVYVTAQTGNFLYKIDTAFANVQQISLDANPPSSMSSLDIHEIILSPDSTTFYITCQNTNNICWYDIGSDTKITDIPTGVYPQEMTISKAKNKMYISCPYDSLSFPGNYGCVYQMDLTTNAMTPIKVGFMPHGIGIDEAKNLLYVASRNILTSGPAPHHTSVCSGRNGFVSYVDLTTLQVNSRRTEISVDPYSVNVRN